MTIKYIYIYVSIVIYTVLYTQTKALKVMLRILLCRFVQYKPTSLEKNYRHELLTEVDLGVNIDLIDPGTYAIDPNGKILFT